MTINEDVTQELKALEEVGVTISPACFEAARGDLSEYKDMAISELADLLLLLHK